MFRGFNYQPFLINNILIMDLFSTKVAYASFNSFLANVNNDEKKTTGKSHMLWGIIGLTIMMGVWAILGVILNTLGIEDQINPEQGKVTLPDYNPTYPP